MGALLLRTPADPPIASALPGEPTTAARVLIVDDHPKVRDGVRALLSTESTLRVVGEAGSGDEALGLALVLAPTSSCSITRCPDHGDLKFSRSFG